jgi:hypothetical protein
VETIEVIEDCMDAEVPYDIFIQKMRPALGGVITPRDFVVCRAVKKGEDGTIR